MNKIATELRNKDAAALAAEVKELQKAHFSLRMQKGTQSLANTAQLKITRRSIARAKTILTQVQNSATGGAQ